MKFDKNLAMPKVFEGPFAIRPIQDRHQNSLTHPSYTIFWKCYDLYQDQLISQPVKDKTVYHICYR